MLTLWKGLETMCSCHHCQVPGGSTVQDLHLQSSCTGQLTRSNRYNLLSTYTHGGVFCTLRSRHYSYFPFWASQGSQSERKGRQKAANRAQKGRQKSRKYWKWLVELTMERLPKMYFILKWNLLCFSVQ